MQQLPIPESGVNPCACPVTGTHVATPRLTFVDGFLYQLWAPADHATHKYEWRPVPNVADDIEESITVVTPT